MNRAALTFVAVLFLVATGVFARSASANAAGSFTVRVAICAPGMTLATLDPDGCVSIATGFNLTLYDVANDANYLLTEAVDNGDGSLSWSGLAVDDAQQGGLAGRFRLVVGAPQGTVASAVLGDYDPDGDVAYLTGDAPWAGVDLYFFQNPDAPDDKGIEQPDLAGAVSVSAFSCPVGVEPQDPDGWAAACGDPINGLPFTLSGVDDPGFEETRVTGQDIVGTTVFPALASANYALSKGPFDKLTLGFWTCDTAAEYGGDGFVAFQIDNGQNVSCAYYWLSEELDLPIADPDEQGIEGAVHVAAYSCPAGFAPADIAAWAATCAAGFNGWPIGLTGLDVAFDETRPTGQEVLGTAVFSGAPAGAYAIDSNTGNGFDSWLVGYKVCDTPDQSGGQPNDDYIFDLAAADEVFCDYYFVPVDATPAPDNAADIAPAAPNTTTDEQSTIVALPDTGSGATAGPTEDVGITLLAGTILLAAVAAFTARYASIRH